MSTQLQVPRLEEIAGVAAATPGVQVLMLYGSRARGDAHETSDWDLGYLGDPGLDHGGLLLALIDALDTDAVDLVDLRRASGLLRFRAAQDGRAIFEREPGSMDQFRLDAAGFWCDAAPVLEPALESVLAELRR